MEEPGPLSYVHTHYTHYTHYTHKHTLHTLTCCSSCVQPCSVNRARCMRPVGQPAPPPVPAPPPALTPPAAPSPAWRAATAPQGPCATVRGTQLVTSLLRVHSAHTHHGRAAVQWCGCCSVVWLLFSGLAAVQWPDCCSVVWLLFSGVAAVQWCGWLKQSL